MFYYATFWDLHPWNLKVSWEQFNELIHHHGFVSYVIGFVQDVVSSLLHFLFFFLSSGVIELKARIYSHNW